MSTIGETAKYICSKNAGPFWLTIDIFCDTKENFNMIAGSDNLKPEKIAEVYGTDPKSVKIFFLPSLLIVKISFPRYAVQGDRYERVPGLCHTF
jgi:hypothetical protein